MANTYEGPLQDPRDPDDGTSHAGGDRPIAFQQDNVASIPLGRSGGVTGLATGIAGGSELHDVSSTTMPNTSVPHASGEPTAQWQSLPHADLNKSVDGSVCARIEEIFHRIVKSLSRNDTQLVIELRTRPSVPTMLHSKASNLSATPSRGGQSRTRHIRFPGRSSEEAWRFSRYNPLTDHDLS